MRKRVRTRIFGRTKDQREALLVSLAESLIQNERIETTEARAKELRPFVEKWITKGKNPSLHNHKLAAKVFSANTRQKLFSDIGPRFQERNGGYTRIIKRGRREKDAAKMAIIELVE